MKYDEIRFEIGKIDTKFVHAISESELQQIDIVNPNQIKRKVEAYKLKGNTYYHKESVVKAIFEIVNDKLYRKD
jgi:hypothetical protein